MLFLVAPLIQFWLKLLIAIMPKEDQPQRMKDFRLVNLCNVLYKLITKVFGNHMRPFMENLISPMQSGFVPGRSTQDNAIVAKEVLHFMRKSKERKGMLAFKINLDKAYDR